MYGCLKAADNLVEEARRFQSTRDWPLVEESVLPSMGMTDLDYNDIQDDYIAQVS